MKQHISIVNAINEAIEFKKNELIQSNQKIANILDEILKVYKKECENKQNTTGEIYTLIINLLKKATKVMDGFDIKKLMNIADTVQKSGVKITEQGLVDAFIKNLDKKSKPKAKKTKTKEIKPVETPIEE